MNEKEEQEDEVEITLDQQSEDHQSDGVQERDELEELKEELEAVKEELRRAKESADNNLNKLKYLMADFDNYRKQMEKQVEVKVETIKAELLLKFVNIRDDYIRALETARQSKSETVVIEGLEGILKNIDSFLRAEGIREIEAKGTPFDPNVHDAIAFSATDDVDENTVTNEIRRGYMFGNKVLRPALVEISRKIVRNTVTDVQQFESKKKE